MVERLSCSLVFELHDLFSLGLIGFGEQMSSTVCNSLDWCSWQDARLWKGMRGYFGRVPTQHNCNIWLGPIKFQELEWDKCAAMPHALCH